MSYQILSIAEQEIFNLPTIKTYLRISHDYDDPWINELINTAICAAENFLRRTLLPTTIKMHFEKIYGSKITLHSSPISEIKEIAGYTPEKIILTTDDYIIRDEQIIFRSLPNIEYVTVEYIAGYVNQFTIPNAIKQGMMLHIAEMYDSAGITAAISAEVQKLYQPYRKMLL